MPFDQNSMPIAARADQASKSLGEVDGRATAVGAAKARAGIGQNSNPRWPEMPQVFRFTSAALPVGVRIKFSSIACV